MESLHRAFFESLTNHGHTKSQIVAKTGQKALAPMTFDTLKCRNSPTTHLRWYFLGEGGGTEDGGRIGTTLLAKH